MPLTIGWRSARYSPDPAERARFDAHDWIRLPSLLDPPLLAQVQRGVARGVFREVRHGAVSDTSADLRLDANAATGLMLLLLNDPVLLAAVSDLTGCAGLTRFGGACYRMRPGAGHQQEWHDDLVDGRELALTIAVGPETYDGGCLEMRRGAAPGLCERLPNHRPGDAVLFRLAPGLQHRVTPVTAGLKTAFAGWFRRGAPLRETILGRP